MEWYLNKQIGAEWMIARVWETIYWERWCEVRAHWMVIGCMEYELFEWMDGRVFKRVSVAFAVLYLGWKGG